MMPAGFSPARYAGGRSGSGVHRSTRELEHAIYTFIERRNHEPKSFIWTKTADQILATLARFWVVGQFEMGGK